MLPKNAFFALSLVVCICAPKAHGAASSVESQLLDLAAQNRRLQAQVEEQQKMIDRLSARLGDVERATTSAAPGPAATGPAKAEGEIRISGEAGLAYFDTQANGFSPNREFRVDDAKVFLDARIWK